MKKKEGKTVPKRRNGYYYINDKEYPSVTKILNDTLNKPGLTFWMAREACRIALKNPYLNEKEVWAELNRYKKDAGHRGRQAHTFAESLFDVGIMAIPIDP